jgi:hypothetical protein
MRAALILAATLAAFAICLPGDGDESYRLSLHVQWGEPQGPSSFRAELERQIGRELGAKRCFELARPGSIEQPTDRDLELLVTIEDYKEEMYHNYAISELSAPDSGKVFTGTAHVEAVFRTEVRTLAEGLLVRERRYRHKASYAPLRNEDPRVEAQRRLVDEVARRARRFSCKGAAKDLADDVERARAER